MGNDSVLQGGLMPRGRTTDEGLQVRQASWALDVTQD